MSSTHVGPMGKKRVNIILKPYTIVSFSDELFIKGWLRVIHWGHSVIYFSLF